METVSFKDLLSKEIELKEGKINIGSIRIPMIQRDYAQGRKSEEIVRNHFLESIFETLIIGNNNLELDFVYGSTEKNEKVYHFIPLDGQQRLTTLFLLYWYIGMRELTSEAEQNDLFTLLNKFTYETRYTSSKFCEKLVNCKISFKKSPSIEILDNHWFHLVFKKDPTIKAMLNMIDSIHEKYNELDHPNLFNNLNLLQFYILPLNDFNLSDELYIKMNARGKQLTEYENFKADLTKWMKSDGNKIQFQENEVVYRGKNMPYYLEIATKLDNSWTDLFWEYSNKNPIDPMMMRFVHRYLVNQHIINTDLANKEIQQDELFRVFYGENGVDKSIGYNKITNYKELFERDNNFDKLVLVLDKLSEHYKEIRKIIKPAWGSTWDVFSESINQRQRIAFLAITLYLEKNDEFDKSKFAQWMRIVWNVVENTNVDSVKTMAGLMELISELSDNSNNIYSFLGNLSNTIKSESSSVAIKEERIKASFVLKDSEWEQTFIIAEKHPFFRGTIDFIITEDMTIDAFKHRNFMANEVFDENGVCKRFQNNGHIFLRALISRFEEKLIGFTLTDTIDADNHLRSMLASNTTIKNTTRALFSLDSIEEMDTKIKEYVKEDSMMKGWYHDNEFEQTRIRRSHESLYKNPDLQEWMQEIKATRFSWNGDHLYVSKPKSWYNWVMVDTCINIVIQKLISKHGFSTENQCTIKNNDGRVTIPYFWVKDIIVAHGNIEGVDCQFIFNKQSNLYVWLHDKKTRILKETFEFIDESGYWICIKKYDYNDENLYELIKREIFNGTRSKSVVSIIKSIFN